MPRTWKSTLLGVVVLCQFAAVLIVNVAGYFGEPIPMPSGPVTAIQFAAERYADATGQLQWWGMFEAGYLCNSVTWDVRIEVEPGRIVRIEGVAKSPQELAAFNLPARLNRRFVFESGLFGTDLLLPNDREQSEMSPRQLDSFVEEVRINNASYHAFFRSIYQRERREHNNWPAEPIGMELAILRFSIRNPITGEGVDPQIRYVCRWRPAETTTLNLPVEAYDLRVDGVYRQFPVRTP